MRSAAVLAALAVCVVTGCAKDPYERLMEEAARLDRTVEARVDGFPYRAFDRNAAGDLALRAAAAEVIASSADDYSIGVAQLARGDTEQAIEYLRRAAEARKDARSWNALAAAYVAAASERTPSPLLDALAAADRAIEICASCPEPLFNRALILERLGLGRHASRAWRQSLRTDATTAWSDEARRRLHLLVRPSFADQFHLQRALLETAAAHGNSRVVQEIVDRVPQQTRALAEVEYLGQWGQFRQGRDPAKAEHFLTIARAIGDALAARSGERLLRDAVNGIDTADEPRRRVIAAAHAAYRTARLAYRDGRVTEAQHGFQDALRRFEEAGSPMALVVRYYLANVWYGLNQVRQAEEELHALLVAVGDSGYRALRAQTLAQIAVCSASLGKWDDAIGNYDRAIADYAVLGEENNASFAHAALGEALSLTARPDAAWAHFETAFRIGTRAGAAENLRLALGLAVQHEVRERAWLRALSLVRIEVAEAESMQNDQFRADTLIRRALLHARTGRLGDAMQDVAASRAASATIEDAEGRRRIEAQAMAVEAALIRKNNPSRAIALSSEAFAFFRSAGRSFGAPELHLERALAYRAVGDDNAAAADFVAGIEALDAQRSTLGEADLRSLMFDRGEELFCETVDLFLARNRVDRAFQYMEHGRARSLLERIAPDAAPVAPITAAAVQRILEGDEILVEFALLRQDLAAIVVSAKGIRVRRWRVDPDWLRGRIVAVHQLAANAGAVAEFDTAAEELYDAIVRPLSLPEGARVTFVPDRILETVPYPALRDRVRGRRLAELNIIALAPSATIWSRDPATSGPVISVLVVASNGTAGGRLPVLTGVEDEAMRIVSLHRATKVLRSDRVTKSAVIAAMSEAEVVHFGGHAVADPTAPGRSFLALADRAGGPELLSAADISQIRLPHTRLVVLAACDTIRGDPTHVEGMPSLARAFLAAGADNVVASLWSVDDERAAPFVESFHAALAAGADPAEALRDAQRKSIRDGDPPAVWGSFLIAGSRMRKMPITVPLTQ